MPKLVRLYIVNVAIGFALAVAFVAMLVWADVAGLRHLILDGDMGWLAGLMMVMFHGVLFGGVQFAIAVMRMADPEDGPKGGRRAPNPRPEGALVPVLADAPKLPQRRMLRGR